MIFKKMCVFYEVKVCMMKVDGLGCCNRVFFSGRILLPVWKNIGSGLENEFKEDFRYYFRFENTTSGLKK